MTLAAVFIRKLPQRRDRDELVFVTDSRLSGGQHFDQGPKIFELPRSDALFCCAGDMYYAYPLAILLATTIASYPRSADRRYPLQRAIGHACRVFTQSYQLIHNLPSNGLRYNGSISMVFGGFSWHESRYRIWKIEIDHQSNSFNLEEVRQRHVFIGTSEALPDAESRLQALMRSRGLTSENMDLEPLEVLIDIINDGSHPDIGGVPQVAKVFRHMNVQLFTTIWQCPDGIFRRHVYGRPLLPYEETSWPNFDPETRHFNSKGPWGASPEAPDPLSSIE